ncbi:MAG: hypothetical protein IAE80_30425 [Anaerolinea sp.]|nr:hypothetical protein [Anaerolinea sp.]
MAQRAYICLTDDNHWAVVAGDGSDIDRMILAVGAAFDENAINDAVADLEAWAQANDIELAAPEFPILCDWALEDLIEPEVFEQVFQDRTED